MDRTLQPLAFRVHGFDIGGDGFRVEGVGVAVEVHEGRQGEGGARAEVGRRWVLVLVLA